MIVKKKMFDPPPEGLHRAVCVDMVNLGWVETAFGLKEKCQLVFELDCLTKDGKPFLAMKKYTASLHEKSVLHKDLKSWRGRAFTREELSGFNLEVVVGVPCQVLIQHNENDGVVYGNITTILKADPERALAPSGGYVRKKDRPADQQQNQSEPEQSDASDLPF